MEVEKQVMVKVMEPKIVEQEKLVYSENPLIIPQ